MIPAQPLRFCQLCLAFALAALPACNKKEPVTPGPDTGILATVDGKTIRVEDLQAELDRREKLGRPVRSPREVLDEMISHWAMVNAARAEGLDDDPEVQRMINNLLIGRLKEERLSSELLATTVSDSEIQSYYDEHVDDYSVAERIQIAMIFVEKPFKASEGKLAELRGRIEAARKMVVADPINGMRSAAVKFSDDQATRYRSGNLGWVEKSKQLGQHPSELVEEAFALGEESGISEVLEYDGGFYLVKVNGRRPAVTTPLAEVKDSIRNRLTREKRTQTQADFDSQILQGSEIEVFDSRLGQIDSPERVEVGGERPPPPPVPQ